MLYDSLFNRIFDPRTFTLNNDQVDVVDKEDDILTIGISPSTSYYGKLFGEMIDIVFRIIPIGIHNRMAFLIAQYVLLKNFTEDEQFIKLIIGY